MDLLPTLALGGAALASLALYADAKYALRSDLTQMRSARLGQQFAQQLLQQHGEHDWSFYHVVHSSHAARDTVGNDEALQFEGRSWTYNELRREIGRMAERLAAAGVTNRSVVCLFVNNSPEFLFAWWALFKLGAIPAPINTKFKAQHIRHCASLCGAEFLITTAELWPVIRDTYAEGEDTTTTTKPAVIVYDYGTYTAPEGPLPPGTSFWAQEAFPPATSETDDFPLATRPRIAVTDPVQYLFTSGTTGLPKAVCYPAGYCMMLSNHQRWPGMFRTRRRFYICLPMFHGTAQVAALPATLMTFGTVILARRFSRQEFWNDCRRSHANAILYIGEMMRYLVQSPTSDSDKQHDVTLAFGLGLAPTVWKEFRARFGVDWIVEYYSATESTVSLINSSHNDASNGKVAHWGPLMRRFGQDTFYLIQTDFETGEVVRDPTTGFCRKVSAGEAGEAICRIRPPIQRKHDYVGEGGEEATEKKTLRDVFETGDEFFRLGDALVMDPSGYISFSDRLGDTYRVKGHNISTTEVEHCLSQHPDIASVNVYAIPMNQYGYEGQLGCAAVEFHADSRPRAAQIIAGLEQWMRESAHGVPGYAVPRFLRLIHDAAPETVARQSLDKERVSAIMKKVKVEPDLISGGVWPSNCGCLELSEWLAGGIDFPALAEAFSAPRLWWLFKLHVGSMSPDALSSRFDSKQNLM
ncbi:hypothetical protein FE257_005000 [Aspergillus nanangensis]|uniref:AMP-dependent synthetase/ligase domain-containing protein n=1 Tax=Aspergillus nanangensis TaxID=2582783 RepID=A0AAD4CQW5_ASPNN|nr:hypothetical protein FE257_005000 [Aspergillus nanangensis]